VKDIDLYPDEQRIAIDCSMAVDDIEKFGYYLVGGWCDPH
jgi:hypothetical protein